MSTSIFPAAVRCSGKYQVDFLFILDASAGYDVGAWPWAPPVAGGSLSRSWARLRFPFAPGREQKRSLGKRESVQMVDVGLIILIVVYMYMAIPADTLRPGCLYKTDVLLRVLRSRYKNCATMRLAVVSFTSSEA